jgi:altronate hydrolase
MSDVVLQLDPRDNLLIALTDLESGQAVDHGGATYELVSAVRRKHKFVMEDRAVGDPVRMYGVVVGRASCPIARGELVSQLNLRHDASTYSAHRSPSPWIPPDVSRWKSAQFDGYLRADGQVGTRNFWLVVPLVFCENRNILALQEAFEHALGYAPPQPLQQQVAYLVELYRGGSSDIANLPREPERKSQRLFTNVDGIRFLTHQSGCGGTREDSNNLCALLAGYLHHPNVAGATVLSLGCQNAEISTLKLELDKRDPSFSKPLIIVDQQTCGTQDVLLSEAVRLTFQGLIEANKAQRQPSSLDKLTIGLKCGGSDGFSGISANPAVGVVSDIIATLGGKTILAEFPELCGVEQELIDRCSEQASADRFVELMRDYAARAKAARSGFDMNPSPGNIQDGLITDAMKSAGAARKSGTSSVRDALDYPEYASKPGLSLLCTPGNDVECVTGQVGAGANIVLFTTGLGTPTGNPVAPVIKIATNSVLAQRMPDIIDVDAGPIVTGDRTIAAMADEILHQIIEVASGRLNTKAEALRQYDFIPWKRGVSL